MKSFLKQEDKQTGILDAIRQPPESLAWLVFTLSKPAANYSSQHLGIHARHRGNGWGSVGHSLGCGPSPVSLFTRSTLEHA